MKLVGQKFSIVKIATRAFLEMALSFGARRHFRSGLEPAKSFLIYSEINQKGINMDHKGLKLSHESFVLCDLIC